MSGLEVAGIVLGAFPLLISGIEHWRDVARVGGFFWRIRKEHSRCQHDIQYHEILYKKNLRELLSPLVSDADEVAKLIADPGGQKWGDTALQERLEARLQESYKLYQATITEMNEVVQGLRKELFLENENVVGRLLSPQTKQRSPNRSPGPVASKLLDTKAKLDYELFRTRFSLGESVRKELFEQLKECNKRLEKLLSSSDRVAVLQNNTPSQSKKACLLESAFKKVSKNSDLLFKALHGAWKCSCQQYHFANLRLEHRMLAEVCFEIILMFIAPPSQATTPWHWKELRCGHMIGCSPSSMKTTTAVTCSPPSIQSQQKTLLTPIATPTPKPLTQKKVRFSRAPPGLPTIEVEPFIGQNIQLCQLLARTHCEQCMGIIGHDDETFHLHSTTQKQNIRCASVTLNHILSSEFEGDFSRRQRYSIALLVASSVGQLQSTPWLRTGLRKEDIIFFPNNDNNTAIPYSKPFIRQGFSDNHTHASSTDSSANDCNFYSLGILLLELCFGRRLEDHPLRKKYPPTTDPVAKHAFDVMAALKWSGSVGDEGGDDYATAVKWCFTNAAGREKTWRSEIVGNVVRPLEICMEHFQSVSGVK